MPIEAGLPDLADANIAEGSCKNIVVTSWLYDSIKIKRLDDEMTVSDRPCILCSIRTVYGVVLQYDTYPMYLPPVGLFHRYINTYPNPYSTLFASY